MKSVTNLKDGRNIGMNEFTLTDCRNISLLMEEECYPLIEEYLSEKCFGCETSLEYMYVLLKGASDFIDFNMEIRGTDGNPVKVYIQLILDKLKPVLEERDFSKKITKNDIEVELNLPTKLYHGDTFLKIFHSMRQLKHTNILSDNQILDLRNTSDQELMSLVDVVPTSLVEGIGNYVASEDHRIQLFSHPKLGSVDVHPFTNDILYKVAPLFNVYDSNTLASMMFVLQPIDPNYMMGLTPKEFAIILSERENMVATEQNNNI